MADQVARIGDRLRSVRVRRGLTQRELAEAAGVSLSLVKKLEQGSITDVRLETARRLAVAVDVATSALMTEPDAPVPAPESTRRWESVRLAIGGEYGAEPAEEPTLDGVRAAFRSVTPLLLDGKFDSIGAPVAALLRDADAVVALVPGQGRGTALTLRSQVRQVAGSLMLHVWEFEAAGRAFDLALDDAQDALTAASVTEERCWGLIRQGRLAETRELAFRWADDVEPRMSKATREELAAWGRLLVRAGAAAIRDNRGDEADSALRLARMAAFGARRDFPPSLLAVARVRPVVGGDHECGARCDRGAAGGGAGDRCRVGEGAHDEVRPEPSARCGPCARDASSRCRGCRGIAGVAGGAPGMAGRSAARGRHLADDDPAAAHSFAADEGSGGRGGTPRVGIPLLSSVLM